MSGLRRKLQQYMSLNNYVEALRSNILPDSNRVYLEDSINDGLSSLNVYGKVIQSNIPEGYTELEYIESSGTQYIDTGIKINQNNSLEVDWIYHTTSTINTSGRIFGARYTGSSGELDAVALGSNTGKAESTTLFAQFYKIYEGATIGPTIVIGKELNIKLSSNGLFVDGTQYGNAFASEDFETPYTLKLFAFEQSARGSESTVGCGIGRCKHFKVWNGNTLAMDLIPAKRKSDNEVGMYDLVSGQFFTNAGTGDFIAGPTVTPTPDNPMDIYCSNGKLVFEDPDIPSEYKRLLDIIFDGNIYYVTNTYLTGADTTTFTMNATNDGRNVLGCYTGSGSGNNLSFYISIGSSGNYVRYKDNLYRPILGSSKLNTDLTLSIGPTGTTGFDTDISWTELEFVSPEAFYIGWLANATSPKFKGSFKGNITVSNRANFVPCERVSDGAIGYYDTYSNTFFENQGTGIPTTSGYDYSHHTIIAKGTPEKLNIKGNNLYDITKDVNGKYIDANGNIGDESRSCYCDLIPVKPGETYTYSGICKSSLGTSNNKRIHGYIDGIWNQQIKVVTADINKPFYDSFVIPAGINGIRISHWYEDENTQIEESVRPTKYCEYLNSDLSVQDLLGIDNYQDVQSVIDGVVTRNVGVKVLDGTEDGWAKTNNSFGNTSLFADKKTEKSTLFCSHFQYDTGTTSSILDMHIGCASTSTNTYFRNDALNTVEDWLQWLAVQYAAGTPVIVVYPLEIPTIESVTKQSANITSNTNVIERNSENIGGLKIEATYKKLR